MLMKSPQELKAAFINEITTFKGKHGSLRNALKWEAFQKRLLGSDAVFEYLTRDAEKIAFDAKNSPNLESVKSFQGKRDSDYYELKLYRRISMFKQCLRSDIPKFYENGITSSAISAFHKTGKKVSNDIEIISSQDLAIVRRAINQIEFSDTSVVAHEPVIDLQNPKAIRFLLSQTNNYRDQSGHSTVLLTIFDPQSSQSLTSVFINSWYGQHYTDYINSHFNAQDAAMKYELSQEEEKNIYEYLKVEFNFLETGSTQVFEDVKNRTVFIIGFDVNTMQQYKNNPRFDLIYTLSEDRLNILHINKVIPMIDASHQIQLAHDDNNCGLYAANFLQAIIKMLNNKDYKEKITEIARLSAANDPIAIKNLQAIFRQDLRQFLPDYYDAMGNLKSEDQLRSYHMKQRWELGNKMLQVTYPETAERLRFGV